MVIEIADIRVRPEAHTEFTRVIAQAASTVLAQAQGYRRHAVYACQETPGRFVLQVEWETLEAHTVGFREGPLFPQWRALIGPYFAQPPHVEHFDVVA